jgi:outer membrane protein assembly factor BamE (lipoprotein component of BamABCDE complex)
MPANIIQKSFKDKFKETIILISIVMIAIGDLGGFKDVVFESYENIVSKFTHQFDYDNLKQIHVGSNFRFLKNKLGEPQLIKSAKYIDDIQFNYYLNEKYILALFVNNDRVVGYSVTALQSDFKPTSLIDNNKEQNAVLTDFTKLANTVGLDVKNVTYLVLGQQLGPKMLYNTHVKGVVDYSLSKLDRNKLNTLLLAQNENTLDIEMVKAIASCLKSKFYALTEYDVSLVSDSILTLREYQFYY